MSATVEHYDAVTASFPDTEQLTVLVVAGATRDQVAAQLEVDLDAPVDGGWGDPTDDTAWALLEIPGGVLAVETTGYGDPANADLTALSSVSSDGAAAVTRSNIMAHDRFGCARAGQLLFDADEYMYIDDPDRCPPELRHLFDLVHDDLTGDDDGEHTSAFTVGLAMTEVITGLEINPDHVHAVFDSGFFAAPAGRYLEDLTSDEGDVEVDVGHDCPEDEDEPGQPDPGEGSLEAPHLISAPTGVYSICWSPGTMSDPPADWPGDAVCVTVDRDHSAWIRKLSADPLTPVYPVVVFSWSDSEPTETFQQLTEYGYDQETSVVLDALGPLHIFDGGTPHGVGALFDGDDNDLAIIDRAGTYNLRVFASLPTEYMPWERHTLVIWPGPALLARSGMYAIAEYSDPDRQPPEDWPADTLCLTTGDTVWIRKLSDHDTTAVLPTIWTGRKEPTKELERLRAAGAHEGSAVLDTRMGLHVLDDGFLWRGEYPEGRLTDAGYDAVQVRVFSMPPNDDQPYEQHFLFVWADPDSDGEVWVE